MTESHPNPNEDRLREIAKARNHIFTFTLKYLKRNGFVKYKVYKIIEIINDNFPKTILDQSEISKIAKDALNQFHLDKNTPIKLRSALTLLPKTTKLPSKKIEKTVEKSIERVQKSVCKKLIVRCPECLTEQEYFPSISQKSKRKVCINKSCKIKFSILTSRIISSREISQGEIPEKTKILQKAIYEDIIKLISQLSIDTQNKDSIIRQLTESLNENLPNDFLKEKSSKGLLPPGIVTSKTFSDQSPEPVNGVNEDSRGDIEGVSGPTKMSDIKDISTPTRDISSTEEKRHREKIGTKKAVRNPLRGIMTPPPNRDISKDIKDTDPKKRDNRNITEDDVLKGIHTVKTPIEFEHLFFKDQVGRNLDYKHSKYENLPPLVFGVKNHKLADRLRKLMDFPNPKDPAQQYKLEYKDDFVLLLSKKNRCVFYRKHPNAYLELLGYFRRELNKSDYRLIQYDFGLAKSYKDVVEIYTPYIDPISDDPDSFQVKVKFDDKLLDGFQIQKDHSKCGKVGEFEYKGPVKRGYDFFMKYVVPSIEHAITVQTHKKVREIKGISLNINDYLKSEIPDIKQDLTDQAAVLIQLKKTNKDLSSFMFHLLSFFDRFEVNIRNQEYQLEELSSIKETLKENSIENSKELNEISQKITTLTEAILQKEDHREEKVKAKPITFTSLLDPILEVIQNYPSITREEIKNQLNLSIGSVTGTVNRLKKKRLLREEKSSNRDKGRLFVSKKFTRNYGHLFSNNRGNKIEK